MIHKSIHARIDIGVLNAAVPPPTDILKIYACLPVGHRAMAVTEVQGVFFFFFFPGNYSPIHIALSHCLLILVYVLGCHWSQYKIKSWSFSAETAAVGFLLNFVNVISREEFSHGGRRGFNHGTLVGKRKKEHIYRWEVTECHLEWGVIYDMVSATAVLISTNTNSSICFVI